MLKKHISSLAFAAMLVLLCGCVSQSDYDALKAEHDALVVKYDALEEKYDAAVTEGNALKAEYDILMASTKVWRDLSDEEKTAILNMNKAEKQALVDEEKRKAAEEAAKRAAEAKKGYATGITYDQIARTPDEYKGEKVKFYGRVVQVIEGDDDVYLRVATKKASYGYYDNVIFVSYPSSTVPSRVLEEDMITIYGISQGLYTYESTMGGNITIPYVSADQIDQ